MWRMSFFIIDLEEDDHCLGEENVQESDRYMCIIQRVIHSTGEGSYCLASRRFNAAAIEIMD